MSMWERVQFIITNIRSIMLAGVVAWLLIVFTLDLIGLIDVEVDCPSCMKVIKLIQPAFADDGTQRIQPDAPLTIRVRI
ncbi:MAG: hypothetical protein KF889_04915 [Alphaproteobacteria bacterium]|nr:hypothetical protein [Alphaproteobacteria bacterium]MCW5742210.1 hypothetical protein [Alphaproteobacteria bacterium]